MKVLSVVIGHSAITGLSYWSSCYHPLGQMLIHLSLKRIFGKELTAKNIFSWHWRMADTSLLFSFVWFIWGIIATTRPAGILLAFILILC